MYNIGYFILNLTMVVASLWIVHRFLGTFFMAKNKGILTVPAWIAFGSFQLWVEYHKGNASILTTVISFCLVLIIADSGYQTVKIMKMFYIILFHAIWSLAEMFTYFFLNFIPISINEDEFVIMGAVISKILVIIIIYIFSVYWKKENSEKISLSHSIALIFIPIGSIYIAANEFYLRSYGNKALSSLFTFSILLAINIMILEIYTKLSKNYVLEKENTVYAQQMTIISRSTEEQKKVMNEFYEEKHNLINELIILKDNIEHCDREKVAETINQIIQSYEIGETILNCGNNTVDALVNFKYAAAKEFGIKFHLKIFIPEELPVNQCDLGIVLGNAMDNAIEATKKCRQSDKTIYISIGIKKGALVLLVKNPFEQPLKRDALGKLLSTKEDSRRHGYGVSAMRKVAEKYDGEVLAETEDGIFILTVVMNLDNWQ